MVKLVKGTETVVGVKLTSTIVYKGFSANLEIDGESKVLSDLEAERLTFEFSSDEAESIGVDGKDGLLTVINADGEVHVKQKIRFVMVESEAEAAGYKMIHVILVPTFNRFRISDGSGSSEGRVSEEVKKYTEDKIEEAMEGLAEDETFAQAVASSETMIDALANSLAESPAMGEKLGENQSLVEKLASNDTLITSMVGSDEFKDAVENSDFLATKQEVQDAQTTATDALEKAEAIERVVNDKVSVEDLYSDDTIAFHTDPLSAGFDANESSI